MSCDPQTLVNSAPCLTCYDNQQFKAVVVYLLCQIAGMSCNPETLLESAKCFQCYNTKEAEAVMLYLLCQINEGGGGGGGTGGVLCGDVDPVDAPTADCTLYYNRTDSSLWYWDANDTAWYEMVAT